jgi:PAS domain S-box-containing protein
VFETLAGQIATALENAELFERQEEAETAMRESAEKIRAVFDAISDGIGVSNMMGEITDVNEGLLNLYGYDTREDVIGRNTMDLIAREDWSAATEGINQTLTEGRSPRQEISLVRAEGKKFIGEVGASLLYDEEGEPSGIISVIRDITDRKEAERALEMTRSSVEASSDAFYWFDTDAKFIDVNQGTLDLLGYTEEEILNLKVFDVDPIFPKAAWPSLKARIQTEGAVAFEGVNQTKDGEQIPVNVVVSYLPFEDQEIYFSIARDISAQKEAQAELERLGLAIRQTADGVAIADLDSNIQFANQAWAEMHGYTVEEILGEKLAIFHSQKQLEHEVLPFNEEVNAKGYKEGEVGHMRKDGSTFLTRMTVANIENDEGEPIGLVATTRDITERKRTEARHSTLIESMQDGVFIIQDGRMQFVNEAFADIVGYTAEDIEGMPFTKLIAPEDLPKVAESYRKRQAGEPVPSSYEWRMLHRDGHYVWVSMTVGVVEIGDQVASMGTIKDVTERIEAEQERERFTVQLGTAAEIAHRASAILDPDELLSETVNLLCERFELYHTHVYTLEGDMLQIRAGYGKAGQVMIDEEHSIPLAQDQSLVARAARSREIVVADDVTEEPGFMPNPLLPETKAEIAVPLVIGDEVLGVFDAQAREVGRFTTRDIDVFRTLAGQLATAVQNAVYVEELQRTTNRLREVDRLKSEFLANMSHELRTPLNSIIGYAEIMMMGIDGDMDAETLEDVRAIYENGQHLLAMINDILDLAKIEAGRLTLKFEDNVDLAQILEEAETSNASLFANKPVEFRLIIKDELPSIRADRLRLHQVFNNLISNAQKFTSEGYVEVRAYPQGSHWICVTVEDTGIGIEQKDIPEIFERFQQVDGSSTRSVDGTGLGLAITRELTQMHGGRIEVESKVGEGSEFTVWLPIEE